MIKMKNSKNLKLNIKETIVNTTYKIDLTNHRFLLGVNNEEVWYIPLRHDLSLPEEIEKYAEKELIELYNTYIKENNLLELPEEERELALDEYRIRELNNDCDYIYEKINSMLEKEMKQQAEQDLKDYFEDMKNNEDDFERMMEDMGTYEDGYIYYLIATVWKSPYSLKKSLHVHEYLSYNIGRNETEFGEVKVYFQIKKEKLINKLINPMRMIFGQKK